jgi:hypothetical protein
MSHFVLFALTLNGKPCAVVGHFADWQDKNWLEDRRLTESVMWNWKLHSKVTVVAYCEISWPIWRPRKYLATQHSARFNLLWTVLCQYHYS